jgi:hypothetical protein
MQCVGRVNDDNALRVLFTNICDVSEGSFAYIFPTRGRSIGRASLGLATPPGRTAASNTFVDASFTSEHFINSLGIFAAAVPTDPASFYQTGVRIIKQRVPTSCLPLYREALHFVARLLLSSRDSEALWKLLLLFDGLILAPVEAPDTIPAAIKRRIRWLRSGDWTPLLKELKYRAGRNSTNVSPLSSDPKLNRALRASAVINRTGSLKGGGAALSAPSNPPPQAQGAAAARFRTLNPMAGVDVVPDGSETLRRPLAPPTDPPPPPVSFTVQEVLKKVRRANKSAAGGPSGTDYMTLGAWFHEDDATSETLTTVLNLIAAGIVPKSIVRLLTAGRGLCVPKDEKGGLRPIVVGAVLLRLIGSLALQKENTAISRYFLEPRPIQFGVGVQGGCELMAAAVEAHLGSNPSHISMGCDAANAFNSVCRTKLWPVLRRRFSSMEAFVRVLYGTEADILFADGVDLVVVKNSVGTRQGCSMGSFIFALMIHPYLIQLAEEFPDVLVLAFADDVNLTGPPERVVLAYLRWKELYGEELQGALRDDKGKIFAPESTGVTAASLSRLGLPCGQQPCGAEGVKMVHDGFRILGAPVGTDAFKVAFAMDRVNAIIDAIDTASHMPEIQLQHLLTSGSLIQRITFLLRNIPGGERSLFQEVMVKYDAAVMDAPRRHARLLVLPPLATQLAGLSQSNGGLGYRTWAKTADAAYLASYVHTSRQFANMFPQLAPQFPDVLDLPSYDVALRASPSARYALRALARIEAAEVAIGLTRACLTRDRNQPLRHLQHSLATIVDDAAHLLATEAISYSDDRSHPRHMAVHLSHCGDPTTMSLVPRDPQTTFSNADFTTALRRRLLVQLQQLPEDRAGECLTCPTCGERSDQPYGSTTAPRVDVFGDHALRCSKGSKLRTVWHDGIKYVYAFLAKMAGVSRVLEPEQMMLFSNDRPDLALHDRLGFFTVVADIRTVVPSNDGECPGAAATPGHAAAVGAAAKDSKWVPQATAQGLSFFALVSEDGGRLGVGALRFVDLLASHAGTSVGERKAFVTFALQRLRCATVKGACALINNRSPTGIQPGRRCRGLLPLGEPRPRPAASQSRVAPPPQAVQPPWLRTEFPAPPLLQRLGPWVEPPYLPGALEGTAPPASPVTGHTTTNTTPFTAEPMRTALA